MEVKRRDTSNSNKVNLPFYISAKYIGKEISKEKQVGLLKTFKEYDKKIKVTSDTDLHKLFKENITSIGIFKKASKSKSDENIESTDFIFLDFDSGMKIEEAVTILNKQSLRYIIVPSHSYSSDHHKFHLYIPVFKRVKNIDDYHIYFSYLSDLFHDRNDLVAKNPSRAAFATRSDINIIDTLNSTEHGELFIETKLRNIIKKTLRYQQVSTTTLSILSSDLHPDFIKHVLSLRPEMKFKSHDKQNGISKFYRDQKDPQANLFINENDNPKRIVDPSTGTGKDHMELLFSNQDFLDAKQPELIREDIVKEIEAEIQWVLKAEDLLIVKDLQKVFIANEGVGKSKAIINASRSYNIVFACQTKTRVKEVADSYNKAKIDHEICYSFLEILEQNSVDDNIIKLYNKAYAYRYSEPKSVEVFIKEYIDDKELIKKLINDHTTNNDLLFKLDKIVIVTTAKLAVMIKTNPSRNMNPIVFDEFDVKDFYPYVEEEQRKMQKPEQFQTFGGWISLYKNELNFNDLLRGKVSIVLTTEYEKAMRLFSHLGGYFIKDIRCKLKAENVHYILTNSTSNLHSARDIIITKVKKLYPEINVTIADGTELKNVTHASARGVDKYKKEHVLCVATFPTPVEIEQFFLAAKAFYDLNGINKELAIEDIKEVIMTDKISQSIGRNSGFRYNGKKCYVILPTLQSNSQYLLRMNLNLQYISSCAEYMKIIKS